MISPLLRTKLDIPSRPARLVPRSHLVAHLNAALGSRLSLVAAPAGYGKTTLVASWLVQLPGGWHPAWLSLDESDNDPVRFLSYLLAALQQVDERLGRDLVPLLRSEQPPGSDIILTALLNQVAAFEQQLILVLDDYHVIETRPIHQQIAFLLDHQPDNLHLVLITRTDPLLPVARLRARGQVLEMRQELLRFNAQECAAFLTGVMGLELSAQDVAALERRTEGWIAGLHLAALSMQGLTDLQGFVQAFTGSSRFILDYLMEEVIQRQPKDVRDFLLKTSILERLSAPLCDAVAGMRGSQALLERLEHSNLFIVHLDQSRTWYRYHRLFAELLRSRLRSSTWPEQELRARASRWFEANGLYAEAIQQSLAGEDWRRVIELLRQATADMLKHGEAATVAHWYHALPREIVRSEPRLCLDHAWPLLLVGDYQQAVPLLEYAEQGGAELPEFLGEVYAAQAFLARGVGDHPRMVERSQRAQQLLPVTALQSRTLVAVNLGLAYWHMGKMAEAEPALAEALQAGRATGNHYAALTALIFQGRVHAVRGELQRAAELAESALQQGGQMPINALAHMDLATLLYEWNQLPDCAAHVEQAIALSRRAQNDEFLMACLMLQSTLRLAQADLSGADASLQSAWALARSGKIPENSAARLPVAQARFLLAKGDLAEAHELLDALSPQVDAHNFYRFLGVSKALLLPPAHARAYLDGLAQVAQANGWVYGLVNVRILQARLAESQAAALGTLEAALTLAQPGGFLRSFIDAGPGLLPLLRLASRQDHWRDYTGRILSAMPAGERTPLPATQPLVEPLSERELQVLRLLAQGQSNREIAAALVVTPGTAKTHVHNLCGKMGVRNRTEAAMKARQLGLI
jgi:LuxR family maltose regulon positive regulatory protein